MHSWEDKSGGNFADSSSPVRSQRSGTMTLHILDIPTEILLMIFSRLPSQTLVTQIPLVCKQFRDLVATPWYWKTHYVQLSGSQPLKDRAGIREWQEGCIQSEFARAGVRERLTLHSLTGEASFGKRERVSCQNCS